MQNKKEIRLEDSETFSILKKQLEQYEDINRKQTEQIRLLESQKQSSDKFIENQREEIQIVKEERDSWMNKYSDFMKQNNMKDTSDNYDMAVIKSHKEELQLKCDQLTEQLIEQQQFLQEQKQWTENWKNKAVQLETKFQEQSKIEQNKSLQKIEELEGKIHRLSLENQHIKNNQILESQIQESERFAKVNAEKQEIQSQYKAVVNKIEILSMEYKNEREDKLQCINQLEILKKETTEQRINYEKKVNELEINLKDKIAQNEQMKRNEKEEQIKEINNRQQQEIETLKMRNKIVQLETELGNTKIELEKAQSKQKDFQREIDSWSKKCEAQERQHKQQIEELNSHHLLLKQSNIEREVKASKLETEGKIFYLDNQVKILTKEVTIWKEKYQSQELEYNETFKLKNAEINECQNKLQLQNQKNLATLNELNENYDKESKSQTEKITEQKHQIKLFTQQIEQLQLENQSLQENSVKRIKELQDIAQKAQQEIKTNNHTELETKIKQLQRQILQVEIEKNQELEEKQHIINQQDIERSILKEKISLYNQEVKNLVSYLEKEKQNVEEFQKQNAQIQKEKEEMENQINEFRDQLDHKSINCDFLFSENEQLNKKITNLKIQLNHVQSSSQQKQSQVQEQRQSQYNQQSVTRPNQQSQYQQPNNLVNKLIQSTPNKNEDKQQQQQQIQNISNIEFEDGQEQFMNSPDCQTLLQNINQQHKQ